MNPGTPSSSHDIAREVEDRLITCGFATDIFDKGGMAVRASKMVELSTGERVQEAFVIEIRKTKGA